MLCCAVLCCADRCRKRYAIFKTHYAATLRLKNYFPFTLIDAMGSIEETRQQITKELRWGRWLDMIALVSCLVARHCTAPWQSATEHHTHAVAIVYWVC